MADFDYNYALTVLTNIRTVISDNANTELAGVDPDLEGFVSYTTPMLVVLNFPAVYVEWAGSKLKKSDDESYCHQEHEFQIGIAVVGTDHDTLTEKILQYTVAVTRVLDKMTQNTLIGDRSSVLGGAAWEVIDHDSSRGLRVNDAGIYRRDAYLTLIVQFIETKG